MTSYGIMVIPRNGKRKRKKKKHRSKHAQKETEIYMKETEKDYIQYIKSKHAQKETDKDI